MTIVSRCTYDAQGQLIHPSTRDIRSARFTGDLDTSSLTLDRGHVHLHRLTATGRTTEHAQGRMNAILARFHQRVELIPGYCRVRANWIQGATPCNGNITITCEILYAIETRNRKCLRSIVPRPPRAGHLRSQNADR